MEDDHVDDAISRWSRAPTPEYDGAVADDVLAWLLMDADDDGSQGELLSLLNDGGKEDSVMEPVERVRFIDDPYSSLLVFQSSSSYITINGNEESCGSSFSDSGTSVMASVDVSCRKPPCTAEDGGSASSGSVFGDGLLLDDGHRDDEFDHCEWDYEMLARFLGGEGLISENH